MKPVPENSLAKYQVLESTNEEADFRVMVTCPNLTSTYQVS